MLFLKFSQSTVFYEYNFKGPNWCAGKQNQLKNMADEGGIKWKCKSRQKKNKGDSKKCKGKCPPGFFSTAPKKVRCDEGIGWMTKKQGPATIAATTGTCVSLKKYIYFLNITL